MTNELIQESNNDLRTAAQLDPSLALIKMENDQIFAVARAAPRRPLDIVKQLQELIDAYPEAADEAIYSKPVGTVQNVTCGDCGIKYEVGYVDHNTACPACDSKKIGEQRKVTKFAEGLSVRAAESIRGIYGYTRLETTCEIMENGSAKLRGTLVDYAAGNITTDERIVSPFFKRKGGGMERIAEDRFLGVVVKAEKSKLRRDVILDSVPNIVKAAFRDACEKKLAQLVPPEVVTQKIIPAFAQYGITPDHLDQLVGRPAALGWLEEHRMALKKILSALKNEETTSRELLDGLRPSGPAAVPAGAVTPSDLAGAMATAEAERPASKPDKKPKAAKPAPEAKPEPKPPAGDVTEAAQAAEIAKLARLAEGYGCSPDRSGEFAQRAYFEHAATPVEFLAGKPWQPRQKTLA